MSTLKYLIHYYNDRKYLFKTVTMYRKEEMDEVFDSIVENKNWFFGRFTRQDRDDYMRRRLAIEEMLYSDFEKKYWKLKEKTPVYFNIVPNLSTEEVDIYLRKRRQYDENGTKYLIIELHNIRERENISFTLDDSFRSYRKKLLEKGIPCRKIINKFQELDEYGCVFHIDELEAVHKKYGSLDDLRYEVQVWDPNILRLYSD